MHRPTGIHTHVYTYTYYYIIPIHHILILTPTNPTNPINHTPLGKTLAFLLPIIGRLLADPPIVRMFFPGKHAVAYPTALVLAPTRELAAQIQESALKILGVTPPKDSGEGSENSKGSEGSESGDVKMKSESGNGVVDAGNNLIALIALYNNPI